MFKYFNNIFFRKTMIVILPIGLLVLIYHYINISNNYLKEQFEIEKYIQNSLYTVEKSYNAIENILEKQMEKNMQEFLNEYDKVEDISKLNLSELKIKFGGDTDLYIINENGVIISSTDEKDIGIDFKKWPELYKNLIEVKNKGTFYPPKFAGESATGKIRKYSYQGTRDKKYIFELGLDFVLQRFDIFKYKFSSFVIVIVLGILFYEFYLVIKKQHEKIERFLTSDKITGLPSRYYLSKEVSWLNNKKENFILVGLVIENIDEILNTIKKSMIHITGIFLYTLTSLTKKNFWACFLFSERREKKISITKIYLY